MSSPADVGASKAARRMFGKRGIDVSGADVRVHHGVCAVRGVVGLIKGVEVSGDIKEVTQQVCNLLRRRPDIREVTLDVIYKGYK